MLMGITSEKATPIETNAASNSYVLITLGAFAAEVFLVLGLVYYYVISKQEEVSQG